MASYTNEYSRLPTQIMKRHFFKDVDNSVADLVNEIKILQKNGAYDKVNNIIKSRPDLKRYVVSSEHINAISEEIRNLEILAKSRKQCIFYQEDEPEAIYADVWIG